MPRGTSLQNRIVCPSSYCHKLVARIKLNELRGCENKVAISDKMKQNLCSKYKHTFHHIFPRELLIEDEEDFQD